MQTHDVPAALRGLPRLAVTAETSEEQARAAMAVLDTFESSMVGVIRFSGLTPWEWHPADELLYILEGTVEVIVLADDATHTLTASAGSVLVVPRTAWHRQHAREPVALLFVSSEGGVSWADDPRASD